jgi:hypothetical protein
MNVSGNCLRALVTVKPNSMKTFSRHKTIQTTPKEIKQTGPCSVLRTLEPEFFTL